jgi:NAD(P)-dependent dehydrogenase (short-subunit alcohol dehydrogenase family)
MTKTYLFVGAGSQIAGATAGLFPDHRIWGISTKSELPTAYNRLYKVQNYIDKDGYPVIDEPIDGLVYFPGTINLKPFRSLKIEDFMHEFEINALGAAIAIQKYLPNLKQGQNPSVVLLSTVAVAQGMSFHASIAMAKGAVQALGQSLAAELAPTIRVNVVAPSLTDTPLAAKLLGSPEKSEAAAQRHPLRKIGQPGDVASVVAFLLSEQSAWITGQVLHVDGGLSILR